MLVLALATAILTGAIPQDRVASGSIRGVVQDATGAVLPSATVVLIDDASAVAARATTDASGAYVLDPVPTGHFTIHIEFPGFEPLDRRVTVTGVRRTNVPAVTLRIAGVSQDITVNRDPSGIGVAAAANRDAVVMAADDLRNLPVFDRDVIGTLSRFLDAAALGQGGATLVVDGMEARKAGVSPAAIEQVTINQDPYSAEFQRPGRGRIEIVTKAGTDAYHGSVDLTFRDAHLNARDPFAVTKPPEQRRIQEAVLGGPVGDGTHASFLLTIEHRSEDLQSVIHAAGPSGAIDGVAARPARTTEVSASWTHQFGKAQTLSVRFTGEGQSRRNQGAGGTTLVEAAVNAHANEEQIVVGHRWVLSRATLSEFRMLVGHEAGDSSDVTAAIRIVVPDALTAGGAQASQRRTEDHLQLAQNVSYVHGRHLIKAGFAIPDLSRRGFDDRTNTLGTFTFASPTDYALGRPIAFTQQQGDGRIVFLQRVFSGFVQDQIGLSKAITVGLGVRYDWQNIFSDANNLAPRFSLAYAPRAGTVVRTGVGAFYDRAGDAVIRDVLMSRQARLRRIVILNPTYPDPFAGTAANGELPPSLVTLEPGVRIPYVLQYSAGLEHELRKGTVLSVTYIGTTGRALFRSRDVNAPSPPDYASRPDPALGRVRQIESAGRQQADSLQVGLRGRLKRVRTTLQYTLGVARNDTNGINAFPANGYDLAGEYGRAEFDQRHRVEALTQIDGGRWLKLGLAVSAGSGRPYTLTTGRDAFNTGLANARPAGVARNTLTGPSSATLDVRWSREYAIGAAGRKDAPTLSVGVSAFNVTNRTNVNLPVGNLSSPFFGESISAQPPRQIQLSAGFVF